MAAALKRSCETLKKMDHFSPSSSLPVVSSSDGARLPPLRGILKKPSKFPNRLVDSGGCVGSLGTCLEAMKLADKSQSQLDSSSSKQHFQVKKHYTFHVGHRLCELLHDTQLRRSLNPHLVELIEARKPNCKWTSSGLQSDNNINNFETHPLLPVYLMEVEKLNYLKRKRQQKQKQVSK